MRRKLKIKLKVGQKTNDNCDRTDQGDDNDDEEDKSIGEIALKVRATVNIVGMSRPCHPMVFLSHCSSNPKQISKQASKQTNGY